VGRTFLFKDDVVLRVLPSGSAFIESVAVFVFPALSWSCHWNKID